MKSLEGSDSTNETVALCPAASVALSALMAMVGAVVSAGGVGLVLVL